MSIWSPLHKQIIAGREPRNQRGAGRNGGGGGGSPGRGPGGGGGGGKGGGKGGGQGGPGMGGQNTWASSAWVNNSGTQSLVNDTVLVCSWNNQVHDDLNFWSASAPTRLTIPNGFVGYVTLNGGGEITTNLNADPSQFRVSVVKNGDTPVATEEHSQGNGDARAIVTSGPVPVVGGDYFELHMWQNGGGTETVSATTTNLSIELYWIAGRTDTLVGSTLSGCSLYSSGAQSYTLNVRAVRLWDSEVFDTGDYHSTVTNTSRITMSGTGYLKLYAAMAWTNDATDESHTLTFYKNGSDMDHISGRYMNVTGVGKATTMSPVIPYEDGDYFEVALLQNVQAPLDSTGSAGELRFAMRDLGDNFRGGCLLYDTVNQSTANSVREDLTWSNEVYDTHGFHTGSSTDIVIPAGVTKARICASVLFDNDATSEDRVIAIRKDGTNGWIGRAYYNHHDGDFAGITTETPPLDVAEGEVYTLEVGQWGGGTLDIVKSLTHTWFALEIIK